MKNKLTCISALIAVFLISAIALTASGCTTRLPNASIEASDCKYHTADNSDGSSLVQIGDKLYYSTGTYNNVVNYGVYEISNSGIRRIWWDGIKFITTMEHFHPALIDYNGQLAEISTNGQICVFDFEKSEFIPVENEYSQYISNREKVQKYNVYSDAAVCYVELNGKLYYFIDTYEGSEFYECSLEGDSEKKLLDIDFKSPGDFCLDIFSHEDSVYVEIYNDSSIYALKYNPETDKAEYLSENEYFGKPIDDEKAIYVINNSPSYGNENGIYIFNFETGEKQKIHSGYVSDWYVVDDKWVYYAYEDFSLWRVSIDGKTNEKVF